jgi:hypothetical protein
MSLRDWLQNQWLTEHSTSCEEISGLLLAVDRDLKECKLENISPEWRLNIAYAAVLRCASIALAAMGYRATRDQYHYRTIQSLKYTIKVESALLAELDQFRKKRNATQYDQIQAISDYEADRIVELAIMLKERVIKWLDENYSNLK